MIKRPLNARFRIPVLTGIKTTTIRNKPWPVGVPIMLYNWSGAAYRSPQIDVAPVIVNEVRVIRITHREDGGMIYAYGQQAERRIHDTEGFASREELDAWFRPLVKRGETIEKALMFFSLANDKVTAGAPLSDTTGSAKEFEFGTCNNMMARRNRKTGSVQFILWKAGEQGHHDDFWHDFDSSWWPLFCANT